MSFLFKYYSIVEVVYLFIGYSKTSSSCETQIILMEVVEMKKTLTKHLEKDNTGKGEVPAMSLDTSEFLFFDIAREASNDVNTFLNLRFIKKQKPAVF